MSVRRAHLTSDIWDHHLPPQSHSTTLMTANISLYKEEENKDVNNGSKRA